MSHGKSEWWTLYFWHVDKDRSLLQVVTITFVVCNQACQSTRNKFAYLCSISRKAKLIFCLQISAKIFYKMIVSLWVCIARHAQSTRNYKFTISSQYFKKNAKDEVDFCLLIIVKSFIKVIHHFRCVWPGMPKLPKIKSFLFPCNILRNK